MKEKVRLVPITIVCTRSKTFEVEIPEDWYTVEEEPDGSFSEHGDFTEADLYELIEKQYGSDFDYSLETWEDDDYQLLYNTY